jgi:signal transduction histidine kinase
VCAEALTNVAKHATARTVTISAGEAKGWAEVRVVDDGNGEADARGSGLRGLADRVEALGGRLLVDSTPGRGTAVTARIPLEPVS